MEKRNKIIILFLLVLLFILVPVLAFTPGEDLPLWLKVYFFIVVFLPFIIPLILVIVFAFLWVRKRKKIFQILTIVSIIILIIITIIYLCMGKLTCICNEIVPESMLQPGEKNNCYYKTALFWGSLKRCEKIDFESTKEDCIEEILEK
jgi:membrane protease YdiL (CAAX protease family)